MLNLLLSNVVLMKLPLPLLLLPPPLLLLLLLLS
jgi:hypothetical protein